MNDREINDNGFIKTDLHIHSPSSGCYKGKKNDNEYLNILRQAKANSIKIISITDHNSIEGYERLLRIKEQLEIKKIALKSITDSGQTEIQLRQIRKDLNFYKDILILPGVEFEVNNGIHILLIFNPIIKTQTIEQFLHDGGYDSDSFGKENPVKLSKWDIFSLYNEMRKYDCLVIDAHTDSNKGILNTIPKGLSRANCFKSPQLHAIAYSNEIQKEKLKSTIETKKEYQRDNPIAFVKFSDSHTAKDVGSKYTWIKLTSLSFESLRNAFLNPSEMISTEEPSLAKILDKLLLRDDSYGIPNLSDDNCTIFIKYLCALNNSNGGFILLGVTENNNKIGLPLHKETETEKQKIKEEYIHTIINCFKKVQGSIRPKISIYTLQNSNVIFSIYVPQSDKLVNINGEGIIYVIDDKILRVLSANKLQILVEERLSKQIETRLGKHIEQIEKECNLVHTYFQALPLIQKFEQNSISLPAHMEIIESSKINDDDLKKLQDKNPNGKSKGNLFYMKDDYQPRYKYGYLRYSLPQFTLRNFKASIKNIESIYIVPGGGVFYSNRRYPVVDDLCRVILTFCQEKNTKVQFSLKLIASFLKSSFFIWYFLNKYENVNIHIPSLFNKIRFPSLNTSNTIIKSNIQSIEHYMDDILLLEKQYLQDYSKVKDADIFKFTDSHNLEISVIAYNIDKLFYELLDLSSIEIKCIEDSFRLNNLYIHEKVVTE